MNRWKSDLILLFVAAIWGSGFVAQRLAAAQLNTFYFNGGRFLLAAVLLLPLTRLQWKDHNGDLPGMLPKMLGAGFLLFAAAGLQQAGLETTTIGNASFITTLYVILVPIIVFVVWRRKLSWVSWGAALLAVVGAGLLSLQGELKIAPGDFLELLGAVVWALHILLVGHLARRGVDVLWLSIVQFAACGGLSFLVGIGIDPEGINDLASSWQAVVYSAIFPIGMGFTLQIAGQKGAPAVDAAIILSMEAVFATLFGYLFLNELLTFQQMAGCFLILVAAIIAQIKPEPELANEHA